MISLFLIIIAALNIMSGCYYNQRYAYNSAYLVCCKKFFSDAEGLNAIVSSVMSTLTVKIKKAPQVRNHKK